MALRRIDEGLALPLQRRGAVWWSDPRGSFQVNRSTQTVPTGTDRTVSAAAWGWYCTHAGALKTRHHPAGRAACPAMDRIVIPRRSGVEATGRDFQTRAIACVAAAIRRGVPGCIARLLVASDRNRAGHRSSPGNNARGDGFI